MPAYQELRAQADQRWLCLISGDRPWIRVGTAMCGQAAGAVQVVAALRAQLDRRRIDAVIDEVGCLGICFAEPLVDIVKKRGSRLFFNNVTPEDVPRIIDSYLVNDTVPDEGVLGYLGQNPVGDVPSLNKHPSMAKQERIALRNAGRIAPADVYQYIARGGYGGLNKALFEMQPADVTQEITDSGLRGRGRCSLPNGSQMEIPCSVAGTAQVHTVQLRGGRPRSLQRQGHPGE